MYQALHTTLTLDDALALEEISDVWRSQSAAEHRNADRIAEEIARRDAGH